MLHFAESSEVTVPKMIKFTSYEPSEINPGIQINQIKIRTQQCSSKLEANEQENINPRGNRPIKQREDIFWIPNLKLDPYVPLFCCNPNENTSFLEHKGKQSLLPEKHRNTKIVYQTMP